MSDDCIAECCFHVLFRCFLTVLILLVDWLVMRRKESIIHNGRRIQTALHLPEALHIFASTDPGMHDRQFQRSSHVLVFIWLLQAIGLLAALGTGKIWSLIVLIPGFVIPTCLICILYLWLVTSRRKLSTTQQHRSIEEGNQCLPKPGDKMSSEKSAITTTRPAATENSHEERFATLEPVLEIVWTPHL